MFVLNQNLSETHIIGPDCRQNELDVEHFPILKEGRFRWIGFSELSAPYCMIRPKSVHSHIVACVKGRGSAWIDGERKAFVPGQVLLGPVGCHHGFEAVQGQSWTIAWVFYSDRMSSSVLPGQGSAMIASDVTVFSSLIWSLLQEASGAAEPEAMRAWVQLLDLHTRRMVGLNTVEDRMSRVWMQVQARLAHPWTVPELSSLACVCPEHFRRLCQLSFQHSPIEHLTHLRLQRASTLLQATDHNLETIAQSVGFASMYSFSAAFKRWSGKAPRDYRRQSQGCIPR